MITQIPNAFSLAAILLSSSLINATNACELKGNFEKCEVIMKIAVEKQGCTKEKICKNQCKKVANIVGAGYITKKCDKLCRNYVQGNLGIKASCGKEFLEKEPEKIINAQCSAHKKCKKLTGDCCPTTDGTYLDCCPYNKPVNPDAQCSKHYQCKKEGLTGPCCPTSNGSYLDCCDN